MPVDLDMTRESDGVRDRPADGLAPIRFDSPDADLVRNPHLHFQSARTMAGAAIRLKREGTHVGPRRRQILSLLSDHDGVAERQGFGRIGAR